MDIRTFQRTAFILATLTAAQCIADPPMSIDWYTVDCGGAGSNNRSTGGAFSLVGTIGQCDAGAPMTGGTFSLSGGFWPGAGGPSVCRADFNSSGAVNSQDFFDFLGAFFENTPAADFNHDGVVNSQDYFAFLTFFFLGC